MRDVDLCDWCGKFHWYQVACPGPRRVEILTRHYKIPIASGGQIVVTLEPGEHELVELTPRRSILVTRLRIM